MKKISLYVLITITVILIGIYILNNIGVFAISPAEYLSTQGGEGKQIRLGSTDGLLILSVAAFAIIIIPAVGYLRKK